MAALPSVECPQVKRTPGSGYLRPTGRYKFAVTKYFGWLSKTTFSMVYFALSSLPVTLAFKGVLSGNSPKIRSIFSRIFFCLAFHSATVPSPASSDLRASFILSVAVLTNSENTRRPSACSCAVSKTLYTLGLARSQAFVSNFPTEVKTSFTTRHFSSPSALNSSVILLHFWTFTS